MAHATPDGHTEHTGHGEHHVFDARVLKKTFAVLCGLTVLTVVLALIERGYGVFFGHRFAMPHIEFGPFSIVVALGIATVKAYWVAAHFMGLKHDSPTYRLVLLGSVSFLFVFFGFTYLDFAFRDTFEPATAVPVDIREGRAAAAAAAYDSVAADAPPFVESTPDAALFGTAPGAAGAADTPADSTQQPAAP